MGYKICPKKYPYVFSSFKIIMLDSVDRRYRALFCKQPVEHFFVSNQFFINNQPFNAFHFHTNRTYLGGVWPFVCRRGGGRRVLRFLFFPSQGLD